MPVSGAEWLARFAAELAAEPPSPEEVTEILAVAAAAAHASERAAAPVSCWLVARAGLNPAEARIIAEAIAASLDSNDGQNLS